MLTMAAGAFAAWLLHGIAGAGSAAVVSLSKWMGIDPSQTQWIADGLAAAGWLAQAVVILIWLLGMGVLGLFATLHAVRLVGRLHGKLAKAMLVSGRAY